MSQLLTVDPTKADDQFYRYKMPAFVTKVEGNGNGIKTVFPNIHDVCLAINRPEELLMKFFQFELGTQRTVATKDDKFLVMGARTREQMQEKVYDFILKFVLCKHCRNPETAVLVDAKDRVTLKCKACGKVSDVPAGERLYGTLRTTYKGKAAGPATAAPAAGAAAATAAPAAAAAAAAAPADAAGSPTAAAAAAKPASKITEPIQDDRKNPIPMLAAELAKVPFIVDTAVRFAFELRSANNFDDEFTLRLVFRAIVHEHETNFITRLQQYIDFLSRFCTVNAAAADAAVKASGATGEAAAEREAAARKELADRELKLQMTLLGECELHVHKVAPTALHKMSVVIYMLIEQGVLLPKYVAEWHKEPGPKKANAESKAKMRELALPLVEWIGTSS